MIKKEQYLVPEVEEVVLSLEGNLMGGSATGFTEDPGFDNGGWGLD